MLALAHALETNKTLTGEDVQAIIEGREGPLIDGRVYRAPEFFEKAEAYHAEVVAAHKLHSDVKVPLPALTRPQPESAPVSAATHVEAKGDGA